MPKAKKKQYSDILLYNLKFHQKLYRFIKVFIDFCIGLIGLILCLLPFVFIGIAIKIDSKGPVFFRQKRIGKKGKIFYCFKFRTMTMDAKHDIAGYQYDNVENYITRVGKFLRKTSLDELPQLFNLVNGTMSLIGYRPSQPSEIDLNKTREAFNMYQIRPGVTGWAQVNGRDRIAAIPVLKAKYDGYYLIHFSLLMDIKVFMVSIIKVLNHSDVEEGRVTNCHIEDNIGNEVSSKENI